MSIRNKKGLCVAVSLALSLTLSNGALAKKPEDKNLHKQAGELNEQLEQASSIVTAERLDSVLKDGEERDQYRKKEVLYSIMRSAAETELDQVNAERELKISQFILDNVPDYVLAAGQKSVNAYILEHFVNKENNAPGSSVKTVWKSTTDAVSMPIGNNTWTPTVKTVEPANRVETPLVDNSDKDESVTLSAKEVEALGQLGLTEKELAEMLGDGATDVVEKQEPDETPSNTSQQTNVVINDVDVDRVVIMGKSKFVDIKLSMQLIDGQNKKKIARQFTKMKPGYLFEVEGVRFELISLTQRQVVFENLETNQTYRELID